MAKYFVFNDVSSRTYNLKCKEINHLSFGAKSYETIKIPGRTGNLLIDDGSYENKEVPVIAYLDLRNKTGLQKKEAINGIKTWLIGHTGYKTLTFDDGISYQAIVSSVDVKELFNDYLQFEINFECVEVLS